MYGFATLNSSNTFLLGPSNSHPINLRSTSIIYLRVSASVSGTLGKLRVTICSNLEADNNFESFSISKYSCSICWAF